MKVKVQIHDSIREHSKFGHKIVELPIANGAHLVDVGRTLRLRTDLIHVVMVNGQRADWNYALHDNDYIQLFPTVGTTEAEVPELIARYKEE